MKVGDFIIVTGFVISLITPVSVLAEAKPQTNRAVKASKHSVTKLTRAQYNARYKAKQAKDKAKLDRQRAAWRKKWEAQQRASKKKITAKKQIASHKLTPAQLRWRKLKKSKLAQQKASKTKKTTKHSTLVLPKRTYAAYRSQNIPAIFNRLPYEIRSKLRSKGLGEYGVSTYVRDVNSPRPLLAYQDTTARVPASVMKLITSYASLGILGPNYRWPLDVYTRGSIRNGTLQGDLYIKGYGSPEFNTKELRNVLHKIRQKGIRNVNGRIVFDNTYFNSFSKHQGSFDNKSQVAYNAKPDALLFNQRLNSFQVRASGK
ncbi:MAG: hypothetical protein DSZ12_03475, partial [Sulfurovum sp.]